MGELFPAPGRRASWHPTFSPTDEVHGDREKPLALGWLDGYSMIEQHL
jgi:hypothetical protein